jgi:hypothetical protein
MEALRFALQIGFRSAFPTIGAPPFFESGSPKFPHPFVELRTIIRLKDLSGRHNRNPSAALTLRRINDENQAVTMKPTGASIL